MLLPFLPGGYDPLAVKLSAMAQTFGTAGLLLVPVGFLWLVSRYSQSLLRKQRGFAITALVVGSVVCLIVSIAGLAHSGFVLGIAVVARWAGHNVLFEPFTFRLGTREIVMFNPRDEHGIMSHDSDLRHHGPDRWQVRGGYYAVHDTPHPHWKYFWFD